MRYVSGRIIASPRKSLRIDEDSYEDWGARRTSTTVHEPAPEAVKTGLLGPRGEELYRVNDERPIGFVHFRKRS